MLKDTSQAFQTKRQPQSPQISDAEQIPSSPKHLILQAADTLKALQAPSKPANVLKPTVPVFSSHSTPTLSPIPR